MARTELQQPRHLTEPDQPRHLMRGRWLVPAAAVVGVLLLLAVPVVFVFAATRTTPAGTRSAAVTQPTPASAATPNTAWVVAFNPHAPRCRGGFENRSYRFCFSRLSNLNLFALHAISTRLPSGSRK